MDLQDVPVPVVTEETLVPPDAEVLLVRLVKRAVTVLQEKMVVQARPDSQVTKVLLEILVQLVPEETRDKTGYLGLLERKGPWETLESDPSAQRGRRGHLGVLGTWVLLVPVVLLVLTVLEDLQVVMVLLDLLDLPVDLA